MRVIAIDGPAGAGKSTIAKRLASRVGLDYLDTGAMYRAITFKVLREGLDPAGSEVVAAALSASIEMDGVSVIVDGIDATAAIRSPDVTSQVSIVAANSQVREALRAQQRKWAERMGGGVLEGRDIGTVVFPDAVMKVFLTASPTVRAERRVAELGGDLREIEAQIRLRDELDSSRSDSPLRHDDDYIFLDTTEMDIDEVVDQLHREYVKRTN
ncbi:MAG: (d)CMP kinase [Actinobacteria bacterium]|jgi:CMP/dCMP kinase|nr:(d)CMP kinase [Actinomycetota bacterium]